MENTIEGIQELNSYISNFNIHYSLLLRRYDKFKAINKLGADITDVITYFDMIVVQLRALCIENSNYQQNYTAQVLLKKLGENKLALKIDGMLESNFFVDSSELSTRDALKILADKFICHYDNFDDERSLLSLADIIMNQLKNPFQTYQTVNLDYIMTTLMECIGDGLKLKVQ